VDYMFRRWVRLPTVLALLKPKRGETVKIRLYTEDTDTKSHHPWLGEWHTFELNGYVYDSHGDTSNTDLAKLAENFVAKTITIDRARLDSSIDCFLIEVKDK